MADLKHKDQQHFALYVANDSVVTHSEAPQSSQLSGQRFGDHLRVFQFLCTFSEES
jgi:hypothetical protein